MLFLTISFFFILSIIHILENSGIHLLVSTVYGFPHIGYITILCVIVTLIVITLFVISINSINQYIKYQRRLVIEKEEKKPSPFLDISLYRLPLTFGPPRYFLKVKGTVPLSEVRDLLSHQGFTASALVYGIGCEGILFTMGVHSDIHFHTLEVHTVRCFIMATRVKFTVDGNSPYYINGRLNIDLDTSGNVLLLTPPSIL